MTCALTEREPQWARLEELSATARAGQGRVVMISGPVAGGKTALLHEFGEHARSAGFTWLSATCAESERSLPFGLVGQLLGPDAMPSSSADDPAAHARTVQTLCQALLERAGDDPVLLSVDDVQHADEPSLDWLLFCIRRLATVKVLLVLTETTGPKPATSPLHTEMLRHRHCARIALAPLSEQGVTALFDGDPAAYELTGGNPLLVKALREDGGQAGPNFQQALLSCLHRCEPGVLRVARALAVLDEPGVAELIDADADVVTGAITVMTASGLLVDGRFRHSAARTAVLEGISSAERADLCQRAAAVLHDRGASPTELAPLLVSADSTENPWAAEVLLDAAEYALHGEQIEEAVRYLDLARRAATGERERIAIMAELARVEWRAKPHAAIRHLGALTEAATSGQLADRDAIALVRQLLWQGRGDDAAAVVAVVRGSETVAVADRRAMELWLACTHPTLARRGPTPLETAKHELGPVGQAAGPWVKSTIALVNVLSYGTQDQAVTDAEHVLQAARPSDGLSWGAEAAMQALLVLVYADRLELARTWCEELLRETATPLSEAFFTCVRAEVSLRQGDLAAALKDARAALTALPTAGWGVAIGFPLGCAITAATRMGKLDEAAEFVAQPLPETMLQSRYGLPFLHARGEYYLATGRDYAALADFLSCGELTAAWGMDMPGLVAWRTSAADAWLRKSENRAEVRRLINEQLAKVGPDGSRTRGVALRLLAATSQVHSRPQLLAEAVAILEGCGDQYELARALADLSRAYRAVGQSRRASPMAKRAMQTAESCGAATLCEDLIPLCSNIDVEQQADTNDRLASLTESELRVAALAAAGFTNREIAGKLYITTSTIEQHLTRVYRKLNVKYRRELPAELHNHLGFTA